MTDNALTGNPSQSDWPHPPRAIHVLGPLLTITLLELFIGGGGRLLDIGPASPRMYLFACCACALVGSVSIGRHRDKHAELAWTLVGVYALIHGLAMLNGVFASNDPEIMALELQQSAYWLITPFFSHAIQTRTAVRSIAQLLRVSALVLATAYLLLILLLTTDVVDVIALYETVRDSPEFSFRNETLFFYKGFLYLGIGLIFFVAQRGKRWWPMALLCAAALLLALTRGFILSTSIALLMLLVQQRRWTSLSVAGSAVVAAALFTWVYLPSVDDRVIDQRETSNEQRLDDMRYVIDHADVKTLLIGEGFGTAIGDRVNVENTFLWALWKMGIFGLIFWLMPLLLSWFYFARIPVRDSDYPTACAFFYATLLVYLQTATNPFLNNPIGLSFVMISIFSLATISKASRKTVRCADSANRVGFAQLRFATTGLAVSPAVRS